MKKIHSLCQQDRINECLALQDISLKFWMENIDEMKEEILFKEYLINTDYYNVDAILAGFGSQLKAKGEVYDFCTFQYYVDYEFYNSFIFNKYFKNACNIELTIPYLLMMQVIHGIFRSFYIKK